MSTNDDHTEVEIGELPGALESLGPIGDNVLLAYFGIYRNCCTPHHKSANIGDSLQKHAEDLRRREAKVVVAGALAGSASDTLEAGIRQWTGCGGMQKDPKKAMDWWASIVGDQALNTPPVPKRYRVRALSCLANAHWEMRSSPGDGPGVWNVDALWHAAFFANECASLGFVSPAVLLIGMQTKELVDQGKLESFRQQRFEGFEFLWEVVDDRIRHVEEKENARDEKVSRSPNAYICAAEGCGIEGTRKSGLMSCAGPCPRDMKPSYCSKECQKTDWKRHKPVCSAAGSVVSPTDEQPTPKTSIETHPIIVAPEPRTVADSLRDDGREVRMEIPRPGGGTTTISSRTMSPAFMKEFRDQIEKMGLEDTDGSSEADG